MDLSNALFRDIDTFGRSFGDILNKLSNYRRDNDYIDILSQHNVYPIMNIYEDENSYKYELELPGMVRENIKIVEENYKITVSGNRQIFNEVNRNNYHTIESKYGNFSRTFSLPKNCDINSIQAVSDKGILILTVNKINNELNVREISIN